MQSEEYEITPNLVDIRITAKDGFDVAMENNLFVILNTEQTEELILEGLAREFVSKVQNIRKNNNLEVTDRIQINYYGTEKIKKAVTTFLDYIKEETLAEKIIEEKGKESYELNGEMTELDIIKITEKER